MTLDPETLRLLSAAIEAREDFQQTTNDNRDDEFYHGYHAFVFLGTVVVLSQFDSMYGVERQFLIWDGKTLRDSTPREDIALRGLDDDDAILDWEDGLVRFVLGRGPNDAIERAGEMAPSIMPIYTASLDLCSMTTDSCEQVGIPCAHCTEANR